MVATARWEEYLCVRPLEIDNDLKPHVQQRSPSVIVRPEVPARCNAFANCGNVLAVQTRDRLDRFSRRNAHGNN